MTNEYEVKTNIKYAIRSNIIVEIPELELYAEGETYEEALKELQLEVSSLADNIWDMTDDQLGENALRWRNFLHEHFVKK